MCKPQGKKATLAICTLNGSNELPVTLEGLKRLKCSFEWEILVVDNGSYDGGLERARSFAKTSDLCVRVDCEPRRGVSFARNRALEIALGEILVFIDDDIDCNADLLESHVRAFEDASVHATGGRIIPLLPQFPSSTPRWLKEALSQEIGGPTARYDFGEQASEIRPKCAINLPFTANMGLRRRVALEVGGFRTDLGWTPEGRRIGAEDIDLMMRMKRTGGKILYVPTATVRHRIRPERVTKDYYRNWHLAYGRASIVMRKRPGPVGVFLKLVEQLFRVVRYSLPPSVFFYSRATRYRKRYQAVGRIFELLGMR